MKKIQGGTDVTNGQVPPTYVPETVLGARDSAGNSPLSHSYLVVYMQQGVGVGAVNDDGIVAVQLLNCVQLFCYSVAHQAPLSKRDSKQISKYIQCQILIIMKKNKAGEENENREKRQE